MAWLLPTMISPIAETSASVRRFMSAPLRLRVRWGNEAAFDSAQSDEARQFNPAAVQRLPDDRAIQAGHFLQAPNVVDRGHAAAGDELALQRAKHLFQLREVR